MAVQRGAAVPEPIERTVDVTLGSMDGAGSSRHADSTQANHSQPDHDDILSEAVLTALQRIEAQNKEMGENCLFGRNVFRHRSNDVVT